MNARTILLTGALGQVGHELRRALAPLGRLVAVDRDELDLTDAETVRAAIRDLAPELIVNAAAYTSVDAAEDEPEAAAALNRDAPAVLADEAARLGALLVHYSTDYVFDGESDRPYEEGDPTSPINVYGLTKRDGEEVVRAAGGDHLILRTSWVYGSRGQNFLRTVLRLASERDALRIVDDQVGAPTWSRAIAEATAQIVAICLRPGADPVPSGTYHMTCAGRTTWFGFARAVLEATGKMPAKLEPIASESYPRPARRPRNSLMSNRKLADTFGITLPDWETALAICLEEL